MTDDQVQPRRRRRSSISERIQRALHVDRSDKVRQNLNSTRLELTESQKRQSFSPGDDHNGLQHGQSVQPTAQAQTRDGSHNQLADAAIGHHTPASHSLQDETLPSTLTYSSQNSRLPSTCTPGSSPSVRPVHSEDEQLTPRHMAKPNAKKTKDKGEICSSPTWKETDRKERRATKRLEAERKELEKRLKHLEESQARLEHGIYDRQARRLTKKQPLDSAKRSSSANSERPRSSRSLSAFFSGSRRSSRTRASSANASDRRRSSDHEDPEGGGPPTLPLSLPERFGTAVSRELASRHGTSLMSNSQLQRSLHHTAAKSDDLRENWKMAEAWQRQNSEHETGDSLVKPKTETGVNAGFGAGVRSVSETFQKRDDPLVYPSFTNPSLDLDRQLFTASLKQEMKPSETRKPAALSSLRQAGHSTPLAGRVDSQGQSHSQAVQAPTTRVTTARQLHNISYREDKPPSHMKLPSSGPMPKEMKTAMSMMTKNSADTSSPAHQKEYKSSPLSLNPVTTDGSAWKENKKPHMPSAAEHSTRELVPKPLRINFEVTRRRGRQSSYPSPSEMAQTHKQTFRQDHRASLMGPIEISSANVKQRRWNPKPIAFDKPQPTAWEIRPPLAVMPPLKHPGRKYALSENSPYGRLSQESEQIPTIITTDAGPVTRSQESVPQTRHSIAEMPASKSTPNVLAGRGHSRSSSGASSYDTADEEVLDTPNHPAHRKDQSSVPKTRVTSHSSPTTTIGQHSPLTNEIKTTHPNPRANPPLAPDGVVSMMRRTPMQKAKQLKKDQLIAKLFVICCHCQYWQDLPSELYAKLACPERIPSESRLLRTFSRRNSLGRRTSLKKAVFGSISSSLGKQGSSSNEIKVASGGDGGGSGDGPTEVDSAAVQPVSLSCCWCGHEMNRSCCQGWTTLVQMRERHH